jgi:hypothetical protein
MDKKTVPAKGTLGEAFFSHKKSLTSPFWVQCSIPPVHVTLLIKKSPVLMALYSAWFVLEGLRLEAS